MALCQICLKRACTCRYGKGARTVDDVHADEAAAWARQLVLCAEMRARLRAEEPQFAQRSDAGTLGGRAAGVKRTRTASTTARQRRDDAMAARWLGSDATQVVIADALGVTGSDVTRGLRRWLAAHGHDVARYPLARWRELLRDVMHEDEAA